ncbi:MAG: response regulator [Spirochaetaceae bacterium]|jgi:two-component system chemotaxis response regulator CheY|nr:response regulator [Spirochaetaceae bacterium]
MISMTILVVDDSRIMRGVIKGLFNDLELGHCSYVEAENGEEAFKAIQSHTVDLVFLDWNMPKMLGIDFLKQIRSIPKFKTVPIIMVTSEIGKANVIEALKNGASDYIIKPIDNKIFKEKVSKILKNRS